MNGTLKMGDMFCIKEDRVIVIKKFHIENSVD